jgi:hypothetical protein
MKDYILLNTETEITRYFTSANIPLVNAQLHQLGWKQSESILCQKVDGIFHPVAKVITPYVFPIDIITQFRFYLNKYRKAVACLPKNFNHQIKFVTYSF